MSSGLAGAAWCVPGAQSAAVGAAGPDAQSAGGRVRLSSAPARARRLRPSTAIRASGPRIVMIFSRHTAKGLGDSRDTPRPLVTPLPRCHGSPGAPRRVDPSSRHGAGDNEARRLAFLPIQAAVDQELIISPRRPAPSPGVRAGRRWHRPRPGVQRPARSRGRSIPKPGPAPAGAGHGGPVPGRSVRGPRASRGSGRRRRLPGRGPRRWLGGSPRPQSGPVGCRSWRAQRSLRVVVDGVGGEEGVAAGQVEAVARQGAVPVAAAHPLGQDLVE